MLNDNDLMKVQDVSQNIASPITIFLNQTPLEDPFSSEMRTVAAQISGVSMNRVLLEIWDSSVFPEKSSITLTAYDKKNIHYFAIPDGRELDPFLEALIWISEPDKKPIMQDNAIREITWPVDIKILIAGMCPHCPSVVRNALTLAVHCPYISVSIIDAVHFEDLAGYYKVKSTPTVIINEGYTSVGQISLDALTKAVLKSNDKGSLTEIIDSMIKTGRAEDAAQLICSENYPQAILPILKAKEFALRIGALFVMEEALGCSTRIFDSIIPELIKLLSHEDAPLRGDTASILGKIAHHSAIEPLQSVAQNDPDPDVREAAEEALEELKASQGD